jgi:hypothetical protein
MHKLMRQNDDPSRWKWLIHHHQGQPTSSQPSPAETYKDEAGTPVLVFELVQGQVRCVEPVLLTEDDVDGMSVENERNVANERRKSRVKSEEKSRAKSESKGSSTERKIRERELRLELWH